MYSFEMLLVVTFVSCAAALWAAIVFMRGGCTKPAALIRLLWVATGSIPIAGLMVGSLETHGASFSWLLFGAAIACASFVVAALLVLVWPRKHQAT